MGNEHKSSTSTNKPITKIVHDVYYVVIMIDASHPEKAFVTTLDGTKAHNPVAEPGHALHYVVKNRVIQTVLSFGPRDSNVLNAVRGLATADCSIKNRVYAFRYNLTKDKAEKVIGATNKVRQNINSNKYLYSGITNDTCAETTLEILRPHIPNLPQGRGPTGTKQVYAASVITPYWLFEDYKKMGVKYKTYPTNTKRFSKSNSKKLKREIVITANRKDEVIW